MSSPTSNASAPLKIAYVVNQYPKVSHSFIRREILALERLGISVTRIAMRGWDAEVVDGADQRERDITQFVLGAGAMALIVAAVKTLFASPARFLAAFRLATAASRRSDRSLLLHWIYFVEACVVARWARRAGVSHLHAHFGTNPAEVAMLAGLLANLPYSFTVHGPEEFDKPEAIALPEKIRRAAFVIAISSYGRSQLFRWVDYSHWPKIQIVHCGVETHEWRAPSAVGGESQTLVCVGRLCEQKGQLLLLSALQRLVARNRACRLVLAGDGELRAPIERRIQELGLQDYVQITGWLSAAQVREHVTAARALVLPSFAEGLPVVLMEAMLLEKPVLSTYVAGIPELVIDRENGWLFAAGDIEAAADAMQACLDANASQLQEMGQRARSRAVERHDIDREAERLAKLFRSTAQV